VDCATPKLGPERSLSVLFLSTFGLNRRQYGILSH